MSSARAAFHRGALVTSTTRRRRQRKQRVLFEITAGAFSAPTHSFDAPGNFRENLSVGLSVGIVLKEDQGTDAIVHGKISDFLTNSKRHPRGIKVRLEDGSIGRVCEIGGGGGEKEEEKEASGVAHAKKEGSSDESEDIDDEEEEEEEIETEEQSNVVYLRGLPKNEEDIEKVKEAILVMVLNNDNNNSGIGKDDIVSVKIPKRSGTRAIQGFGFIECKDIETASNVIRELNGQSLEIVKSKSADEEDDDSSSNSSSSSSNSSNNHSETTAMKLSASFSVNKKKTTKLENGTDESKRKGKKSKPTKAEKERLEHEKREQQIIEARKAMEEDALKLLERQRREKERKEKEIQAKLEKEEVARQAKEKRTMELLLKRKEAQDRNRAKVQAEQERLDRIDQEAKALGDIAVDESWLMEMEEIKAKISALK